MDLLELSRILTQSECGAESRNIRGIDVGHLEHSNRLPFARDRLLGRIQRIHVVDGGEVRGSFVELFIAAESAGAG